MSHKTYLTLLKSAEIELREKKSRFIAYAAPVNTEADAQKILEDIKAKNRDARHNVYAYQIGMDNEIQRSCDDKEPAGTGGRPVLQAIKNLNLQNTLVVVTRYFGGILLGASGLTRAYGKSAALALNEAGIIRMIPAAKLLISFDYSQLGRIEAWLNQKSYEIQEKNFKEIIAFSCLIPLNSLAESKKELEDLTSNNLTILNLGGENWLKIPEPLGNSSINSPV